MATKHKIGWIGLGRMGEQMADRLIKAGHDVSIWNRTKAKADPLVKKGGKLLDKPVDLAATDRIRLVLFVDRDAGGMAVIVPAVADTPLADVALPSAPSRAGHSSSTSSP